MFVNLKNTDYRIAEIRNVQIQQFILTRELLDPVDQGLPNLGVRKNGNIVWKNMRFDMTAVPFL